jgi:hypothetical protein
MVLVAEWGLVAAGSDQNSEERYLNQPCVADRTSNGRVCREAMGIALWKGQTFVLLSG